MAKIAGNELSAQAALGHAEAKETTMQAQNRFARLVLPFAVMLPGLVVQAAAAESQSPPAPAQATATDVAPAVAVVAPAGSADGSALATPSTSTPPAAPSAAAQAGDEVSFGVAMNSGQLDEHRGGDVLVGQNNLTGSVADNTAYKVSTGSNAITQGSFASSSGLPTVIQNTGANVLIQNATVLNVRFGD
jgi:hypothetical protein